MAACVAAFSSMAVHAGYFLVIHKMPVYIWGESVNFSIRFGHWNTTGVAMALAGLAAAFLVASCLVKPRIFLSWLNLATLVLLLPATYTGCCIMRILL